MPVEVKKHEPSGTIILNFQARRNALSRTMVAELQQAFSDFHLERSVRAVILTGAGDVFCSGLDLAEMRQTRQSDDALEQWHKDVVQVRDLLQTMLRLPKPIIAAVNGLALGAGAALVLASDLVIGSPQAGIGLPEARRGIVPGLVAPLLTFRVGASLAANLMFTSRTVDAMECERHGLLHEVVPHDSLWARAHALAQECAHAAPESMQLTKQLLNESIGDHLTATLAAGAAASASARTTDAAAEGVDAFLEKREPNW